MREINPYFMDYRKIYELFFEVTNFVEADPGSDADETNTDQKMVDGVLQKRNIDESWYNIPFTVIAGGHFEVGDKHYTKRSGKDYYELLSTVKGHGIVDADGQTFNCTANTVLLLNCNEKHSFCVKKGETWEYKHIHFIANGVSESVGERAKLNLIHDNGIINTLIDDLFTEYRHVHADSHYILSNCISSILTNMIRFDFKSSFTDPQESLVQMSAKFMRDHYAENINITDLASKGFISPYYFVRLFKKYHGVPPYNYLMNYRLKQAQYMLVHQKSVKDVMTKCGFSSTNSFTRAFKKQFGISPSKYRERMGIQQMDPSTDFSTKQRKQGNENIDEI